MHQALGFGRAVGGGAVETIVGTANQITVSSATGDVTLSIPAVFIAPGSIQATTTISGTSGTFSTLTSGRVPFASTGGLLIDDADMTFATDTLTVTKLIGSTSITDSGLTAGRVTFASTGGLLADSSAFTFAAGALTIGGNLTFGTAGSILSGTTGSQGITVTGTNQSWTFSGVGTGSYVFSGTGNSSTGLISLPAATTIAGGFSFGGDAFIYRPSVSQIQFETTTGTTGFNFNTSGSGEIDLTISRTGATPASAIWYIPSGSTQLRLYRGGDRIVIPTTGNLLLGGLTTDGTGILQFPAATTSAGGITFGTDTNFYRTAAGDMTINGVSTDAIFRLDNNGAEKGRLETNGGNFLITAASSLILRTNTGTIALTLDSSQNAQLAKLITSYNGIATAGNGVVTVQGAGRSTAQVAAVASVATYTVGAADASFEVSANVLVTTSTAHTFTATVAYTDEGNTARTLTLNFSQLTGAFITAITNVTGAGPYEGVPVHIRCKASTAITVATTGTFTTVTYNVEGNIRKLA